MEEVDENSEFEEFWDSLNQENLTEDEYLSRILGPKHLPFNLIIPLTLGYMTIFVSGVIGNIMTCVVIIKNSSMHTATNYYLFSLAISDLILLTLGLPNEVNSIWQQYPWILGVGLCKIRAYVSEMSSYVSVLTIVAFSMERYLAICHPLRTSSMGERRRAISIIFTAWFIAIISALPFAIYTTVNYVEYPPDSGKNSDKSAICAMLAPDMPNFPLYELSSFIFFIIPIIIIFIFYMRIGLKIRNSSKALHNSMDLTSAHWDSRQIQSRKSIIKMLCAVVITFFLCWAPFHAQRLLYVYAQEADYYPDLNEWLYILSGFLYYFSTTINPILYNVMSSRYRQAFKKTICCKTLKRNEQFSSTMNSCRCGPDKLLHKPSFRCTLRNTFDQAKEILKSSSTIQENNCDIKSPIDLVGNNKKINENSSSTPLLSNNKHYTIKQQSSVDSTTSTTVFESSLSNSLVN